MSNKKDTKLTDLPFVNALTNTVNKKQQKGFLCMFSGGLDSTALLHALLTNPEYEKYHVYVHHVRMPNRENREQAETQAARRIVKYYHAREDIREFDYKESVVDTTSMDGKWSPRFPYDIDIVCFMAAQVCLARPSIKYVGLGVTKDDFDGPQDGSTLTRINVAPGIFNAALYLFPEEVPRPSVIYPTRNLTKGQLWNSLPPNIQQMTWSCRTPVFISDKAEKCGKCHTCLVRKKAGIDS